MRKLITLLFLAALSAKALSARWVFVGETKADSGFSVQFDGDSVTSKSGVRGAWVAYTYATPQPVISKPGITYASTLNHELFDCAQRTSTIAAVRYYAGKTRDELVHTLDTSNYGQEPAAPDSVAEAVLIAVCRSKLAH